ncbi:MAG: histone deacetylase family protein [Acuticoccus sp.]
MRVFFAPETDAHDPAFFLTRGRVAANEERPERARRLLAAVERLGLALESPPAAGRAALLGVHTARYLDFLATAHDEWQRLPAPGPEVLPGAQPRLAGSSYPAIVSGRAGWHLGDLACPVGPATGRAALRSADCAIAAADRVAAGAREAYALSRPPGHHAAAELAAGHCYLNNAALAAERLRAAGARPAILDIDVHHGNGTQAIFYDRADIATISVHADPSVFYPFFTGHAGERGEGAGEGANHNIALPFGSGDGAWLEAVAAGLAEVARFGADTLVLALGFDVYGEDPLSGLAITTEGIGRAGALTARFDGPIVVTQEGGYVSPALTDNAVAFFSAFLEARR